MDRQTDNLSMFIYIGHVILRNLDSHSISPIESYLQRGVIPVYIYETLQVLIQVQQKYNNAWVGFFFGGGGGGGFYFKKCSIPFSIVSCAFSSCYCGNEVFRCLNRMNTK